MATSAGNIPISATFAAAQLEKDVLSALNRIQSKSNLSLNTRNFSQPLGKITGLANEFQKSLEASNARVVAFGASAGLIYAVQKSFSSLVTTTIEVEKSLTDINVVLNTSSKGIKQFGDQLFNVAKNTGSAFKDVASAATEFSRQGLGLEETLKRTRDALILTRLSGLDVVSSTEALTAAVNSFTKEALTTTDVVNKLAAVDAKFAVSSRDLSEAIQRVGSSASEAGVSFDELLGIVTSVQQTTARGGAVIGNALKTIFTRIERPQVISDLKDFGVAVTDISGNALPTIKVIENLAQSFQNLNPVVKSQVAELVGGVYQINILKAALADVSKQNSAFAEATRTSSKAADEAILKNKALNESLSALLNETTINFTKFATSIGESSIGPGIRKVLGYVNSSLEAYNEKDAEGVGEKIATGVLTGVTNFVTGPGLGIGAFAIGKLLANFTKFAGDATKNLLGLNTLGRQQAVLQSEIGKILSDNPDLIKDIISGSRTRLQVEQQIKQTLIEQAALSEQIKNSSIDIGGRFLASGLRVSEKNTIVGRRSAEGYVPAKQQAAEMVGAMQGGYAPGRVVAAPKSIGGVMNTAETVKYIPGFAQPYILPPQGSRAAQALASKSMAKNGINPYMARGFVPNFSGTNFTNPYGYGDDQWFRDGGKNPNPVPLSQIKITNKAGDVSGFDGKKFYKKDKDGNEKKFTAIDLNAFLKRGATYGEIRRYVPDSILEDDPRWKSGAVKDLEIIRRDFAPGKKIAGQENIKEGIRQVYEPYVPPASMLVFDLDAKNKELFADKDTEEISTKRKEEGKLFKIKSYALNSSSQNEEKTRLIQETANFSRSATKKLASYIRPGEYSDDSVDSFFNRAGRNYSVLAGTVFEAATNLAANYTRDQVGGGGGDFDVIGGNIGNIRQFFPGFEDQYGDYKLRNNDDAIRSFINKVKARFRPQMASHFEAQEKKVGQLSTGFSQGFIPNFAYSIEKPKYNRSSASRSITDDKTGSYLDYRPGKVNSEQVLKIGFINSKQRGQGHEMFDRYGKIARRLGQRSFSDVLIPQKNKIIPREKYNLLNDEEKKKHYILEDTSLRDALKISYPQLMYREKGISKESNLNFLKGSTAKSSFVNKKLSGKEIFSLVLNELTNIYGSDVSEFVNDVDKYRININELYDTFSKGHIPNFAYKIKKGSSVIEQKIGLRKLYDSKTGSFLDYYPGSFVNPNTGTYEKGLKISFIESSQRGQGQEMFDRYSKTAKRLGVNSYSSTIVPQGNKLKRIIPQKQYDLLKEEDKEKYYPLEKTSIEDIVKIAYPQLSYRQKGLSKSTNLKFSNRNYIGRMEEEELFGKNILSLVQGKIKDLYKNDKQSLIDAIIDGDINIDTLVDTFSKGFIPNFNPVAEAMKREMSAGYSASQVKLGKSDKLKTSFNPMGLGVYNSTEGSLNNGIGLAEKAGIDPKTKGMSAKGHIPNFADFGGADAFILIAAFGTLSTALKEVSGNFQNLKTTSDNLKKSYESAAASFASEMGKAKQSLNRTLSSIESEVKSTFTNIDPKTLKQKGSSVAPLVMGPRVRDALGTYTSSPQAASPEQVARLEELRNQTIEARKQEAKRIREARAGLRQMQGQIAETETPFFSRGSFSSGGKADRYVRGMGTQIGLIGSVISNVAGQFISPENKTAKAAMAGVGEISSFAGLGAQFGVPGMVLGGIAGLGSALLKLKDAKAEEAIDKINKSLGETKEKSSEFSGAAQNYATSLEGLQNALNDPKTKPEALVKFQNNLTEALNSIPEEFRSKVLAAGSDITKVSEAIGNINKEMANTQKNLERQLAITEFIEKQSSIFGRASLKPKDQEVFNRLFTSSIKSEELVKKFTGKNAKEDFGNFIDSLKSEAIYNKDIIGPYNSRLGTETLVNKESAENIKAQLRQKTIIPEEIINQLDKAFAELDGKALGSLLDSIKKAGISVFDFTEKTKILGEIAAENAKRIKENEEALKALNNQYNDINLQISNQIDIEKNRVQTIREINKIQAEGAVSVQRARVKGLLESASPFISESAKTDIQNQLDLNEITSRQNSKIQEASNKLLDSFTNTIIKKSEEARSKVVPAIEGAKSENAIQQERSVFQNQIQKLTPLITQSLKEITSGGNIGDIQANLIKSITGFSKFKPEERDVLIQSLEVSFAEFQNTLAEIKAQGDVDIQIQEAQREYQKQSLALNQRLSFAGGAQALSSTGKTGVSDLFDNISELVSELRQTNTIGNAAQKGSSAFKLLDVLTNQLQLNRNINAPNLPNNFIGPNISGEMFNKQVSSDLTPLAATAIAGRVQQIRDSLDLARKVTEIQTGKTTQGTALGTAFDQAKEGAVRTALDQIASQFKLENMGNYLDVLQQEARFLNQLTQDQNSILESTLPKSINDNFNTVVTREVGTKLTTLTTSLQNVINKLATDTKRTNLLTERSNLLPVASVGTRKAIFDRIAQSQDLTDLPKGVKFIDDKERISSLKTEIKDLESYLESLKTVGQAQIQPITKELQRYQPQTDMDEILSGLQRYQTEEQAMQSTIQSAKISSEAETKLTEAKSTLQKLSKYEGSDPKKLESLLESLKSELIRSNEPTKQDYLNTTYEGLAKQIFRDFNQQMSIEDIKSLKENARKERNLATEKPLMDVDAKVGTGSGQGSKTSTDGGVKRDIPSQLRLLRENADRITSLLAFRLQNDKELIDLNEKVNTLLKGDVVDTAKRAELIKLQTELRAKTLEQEGKVAEELYKLYYKESFGETFFKEERAAFANAKIENKARKGEVDIGAITEKNTTYNRADFARDTGQLIDTFQTDFKSGIASAFGEAIKGTKTLKDAFRDMFQGILNRMLDKSLEMGVDALFAFGKAYAQSRKDGGLIKGYNSGGMVVGGSGMKDDVPAMMSGGEFVIKKSSVNKYGANYLRALNGGMIPKYAAGGFSMGPLQNEFLYDNPDRPTSGEFAIDSRLSATALTDENNPQNRLRQDRYEKLDQYLQDRAQYERDKQQAIKNYKNQVNSTFYSGLTAAAVQLGAAGLTVGAQKLNANPKLSNIPGAGLEPGGSGYSQAQLNAQYAKYGRANGGYIARFAGGGSTGKDNIPALLMGGEYVMNKKAVDMYGRDFMNQLNTGTLPKYASGGMVGTSYTAGQNTPESSVTELVAALNTLNENLSKGNDITQAESGKISAAGANQESGMSVVNNISINVAQSGEVTSEANATTQNGGSNTNKDQNSIQNNAKLAELLRSKVVEVLVEQKRPGGLLYASR